MAEKNSDRPAQKKSGGSAGKGATNLWLHKVNRLRGTSVARELGYNLSDLVDTLLEKLWEERRKIPKRQRGDHLQITLFDRVTEPEEIEKPSKRGKK